MKTQKSKNIGSAKSSSLAMLVILIIICKIFLFANNYFESLVSTEELTKMDFVPTQQLFASETEPLNLETEKLNLKMKLVENVINSENQNIKSSELEGNTLMEKMKVYLVAENEPELDISIANSIGFQDANVVDSKNDNFLMELKIIAAEKTREMVELYFLEKSAKEYLTIEIEHPLELEEWMISDKCWCPELRESMALNDIKTANR